MSIILVSLTVLASLVHTGLAIPAAAGSATILSRADDIKESYDYVIVGGGTSGLTVADRLTEDGKTTVLVIEYGLVSM